MYRFWITLRSIFLLGVGILAIGGLYLISRMDVSNSQTPAPLSQAEKIDKATIVAQGLNVPWAIAFLPDGKMLVTERKGTVRIINGNGTIESNPAANINADTKPNGEGGLLGITLHPDFSANQFVYLYYTYQSQGNNTLNRVVRMKFESDRLTDEEVIVDQIPGALFHNGGRIKFGPDKNLYITTGDAQNPSQAQDISSLAGKILRVTDQGRSVSGNPFSNLVYSYGHRNPQGIAWDNKGQLWETEHGRSNPSGFDEINLIQSGKNYGWPEIQGDQTGSGMEPPKLQSGADTTWAPAGAAFFNNSLFFAGLRGQTLYEAITEGSQVTGLKEHISGKYGRLREVVLGPDGMLYITTSNTDGRGSPNMGDDKIIRINPQKL